MNERVARDRVPAQSAIRALLEDAPAASHQARLSGPEDVDCFDLFSPESTAYQAHARPGHVMLPSVHFILKDRSIRSCQYNQLESDSSFTFLPQGKGNRLVLRFSGTAGLKVVIEGRNLWRLYDYIAQHRMAWVHELSAERDFEGEDEAVVNAIDFETEPLPGPVGP